MKKTLLFLLALLFIVQTACGKNETTDARGRKEIVLEEARLFFDGHISAEKVIDNINNRMQLYLNEIK